MNQANVESARLLTISQVNALTGVKTSTIRHWEKEFREFLDSVRTQGNQRRFSPDAIEKIETIKELVEEQGLTLRGVRRKLGNYSTQLEVEEKSNEPSLPSNVQKLAELVSDHVMRRLFRETGDR